MSDPVTRAGQYLHDQGIDLNSLAGDQKLCTAAAIRLVHGKKFAPRHAQGVVNELVARYAPDRTLSDG